MNDFIDPATVTVVACDSFRAACNEHGIRLADGFPDEDGVNVTFESIRDAETLLALVAPEGGPGTLTDRASGGCVSMTAMGRMAAVSGHEPTDGELAAVITSAWAWVIHPAVQGRLVGWHVHVTIPSDDAMQCAAALNEIHRGYAL